MNLENFIKKIIQLYQEARLPKFYHKKLHRGRSHSISSVAEDLLAYYLVKTINTDNVFIDQPITITKNKSVSYPDIIIERAGKLIGFIDLKTDIGWGRDSLYSLCRDKYRWLQFARGKNCKLRDGLSKREIKYIINKKASFNIVIISGKNISDDKLKRQIAQSKKLNPDVGIFILSEKEHPNAYGFKPSALLKEIDIKNGQFTKLVNKLKR